jgi:hypothetical protein
MPFVKGQSGNPAGRPPGAPNKATLALEAKLETRADEIVGLLVERALAGQMAAMRMCIERLLPRGRERPVPLELPTIRTGADVERAVAEITAAVGTGAVTPREGLDLIALVERSLRLVQAARRMPEEQAAEDRPETSRSTESCQETTRYNEQPEAQVDGEQRSGSELPDSERDIGTAKYNGAPGLTDDPVISSDQTPAQRTTGYSETSVGEAASGKPMPHPAPRAFERINEIQRAA